MNPAAEYAFLYAAQPASFTQPIENGGSRFSDYLAALNGGTHTTSMESSESTVKYDDSFSNAKAGGGILAEDAERLALAKPDSDVDDAKAVKELKDKTAGKKDEADGAEKNPSNDAAINPDIAKFFGQNRIQQNDDETSEAKPNAVDSSENSPESLAAESSAAGKKAATEAETGKNAAANANNFETASPAEEAAAGRGEKTSPMETETQSENNGIFYDGKEIHPDAAKLSMDEAGKNTLGAQESAGKEADAQKAGVQNTLAEHEKAASKTADRNDPALANALEKLARIEKAKAGLSETNDAKKTSPDADDKRTAQAAAKKKARATGGVAELNGYRSETVSATSGSSDANTFAFKATSNSSGGKEVEMTVQLRSDPQNSSAGDQIFKGGGAQNASANQLENFLTRELHQNLNGDIVRQASVVLHEGGQGTIRLNLKPESLGNVKIHLEMSENKVTGNVIVESDEALKAFEHELRALEQTFRDGGFDGATLNLELADGRAQDNADEARRNMERMAIASSAGHYDAALETVSDFTELGSWNREYSGNGINVLV
jgi:flagellar hook-length control protein FliK